MSESSERCADLANDLAGAMSGSAWPTFSVLLHRLAEGRAIEVDETAALFGCPFEEVEGRLSALPSRVERDELGRIVGAGLTLMPTEHRFEVGGRKLYVWCAVDALMFPRMLDRVARVESRCASTGAPVRLLVGPGGVKEVDPAGAVVTIAPRGQGDLREWFCARVNFYASADAARAVAPADVAVVTVQQAYELAVQLLDAGEASAPQAGAAKAPCCAE